MKKIHKIAITLGFILGTVLFAITPWVNKHAGLPVAETVVILAVSAFIGAGVAIGEFRNSQDDG